MLPRDGKCVIVDFRGIEDAAFAEVADLVLRVVDDPTKYDLPIPLPPLWAPPEKIDIDRLPKTGEELFGRQKDLEFLDDSWESNETNIVSLVAWGGVGKSTLVNKWLERIQADNYRGALRVYAWSFYSQGTGERVTSADLFINDALKWFGDSDPMTGSPWDKGIRLAKLIQSAKTLLVLDGLEPLQSEHAFERGRIKEPALVTLLTELARQNEGLCLITTREPVTDLDEFARGVVKKDLEQISDEAGRALLRVSGIQGTDTELERATRDFGNHALAVNLLAVYLLDVPGSHVSHASEIPNLDIPEKQGRHPRRVMAELANRFGDGPEVELLRMIGFFDRPADKGSQRALRKAPVINGLSNHIRKLSEAGWLRTIEKLRKDRLIAPKSSHRPDNLDAHPLVREHFGEQLKEKYAEAWRVGNSRLFAYLKDTAKVFPETLDEMVPLYAAIRHGCWGGHYEEALFKIYWQRIRRGNEAFSTSRLGAYSADLAALTAFFDEPWTKPVASLTERSAGLVLNQAGYRLKALGRLLEATKPMEASLAYLEGAKDWLNATREAENLSDVNVTMGDLRAGLYYAQKAVDSSDRVTEETAPGSVGFYRASSRAGLAYVQHQMGRFAEAQTAFEDAEDIHKKGQPNFPLLYAHRGNQYCSLLLDQGKYREVLKRVDVIEEWAKNAQGVSKADLALINLSSVQALISKMHEQSEPDFTEVTHEVYRVVNNQREAIVANFLCDGLLTRARLHRLRRQFDLAGADIDEAKEIAKRGSMGLIQAECHLEYARLYLAQGKKENAETNSEMAKEMIEQMGYHRRDKDVKEIEDQLDKI